MDCLGEGFEDISILLYESEEQRNRQVLGYVQAGQAIIGQDWEVLSFTPFDSIDQVALALGGAVISRWAAGFNTEAFPPPPVGPPLNLSEAARLVSEGSSLFSEGEEVLAIPLFNQVIAGIDATDDEGDKAGVRAPALFNRGMSYETDRVGPVSEAILSYQWLVEAYSESSDLFVQEVVINGMFRLGIAVGEGGDPPAAVEWFDKAIQSGKDTADAEIEFLVADSMFNKAFALALMDDTEGAKKTLRHLIDTFSDSDVPDMDKILTDAEEFLQQLDSG